MRRKLVGVDEGQWSRFRGRCEALGLTLMAGLSSALDLWLEGGDGVSGRRGGGADGVGATGGVVGVGCGAGEGGRGVAAGAVGGGDAPSDSMAASDAGTGAPRRMEGVVGADVRDVRAVAAERGGGHDGCAGESAGGAVSHGPDADVGGRGVPVVGGVAGSRYCARCGALERGHGVRPGCHAFVVPDPASDTAKVLASVPGLVRGSALLKQAGVTPSPVAAGGEGSEDVPMVEF